jgi:hypothetical protein
MPCHLFAFGVKIMPGLSYRDAVPRQWSNPRAWASPLCPGSLLPRGSGFGAESETLSPKFVDAVSKVAFAERAETSATQGSQHIQQREQPAREYR